MPIDLMSMAEGADPAEARKSLSKRNSSGLQDNPFLRSDSQKAPSGAALEKRPSVGSGKKWARMVEVMSWCSSLCMHGATEVNNFLMVMLSLPLR